MTKRVALSNRAGGAGKTTTTLHTAGALADDGKDVLAIDLDPQGVLTEQAGMRDIYDKNIKSIHEVLVNFESRDDINEIIRGHEEFDIIPSNIKMHRTETELPNVSRNEEVLKLALDQYLNHDYDYIVVDCPPQAEKLNNNALLAAGNIIVPSQPRHRFISGIEGMADAVRRLSEVYNRNLNQLCFVVNEVQRPLDNEQQEIFNWFENFDLEKVYIDKRVALSRAANKSHASIFSHDERCDAEGGYKQIANIIKRSAMTAESEVKA